MPSRGAIVIEAWTTKGTESRNNANQKDDERTRIMASTTPGPETVASRNQWIVLPYPLPFQT
jgi:hypothetical protein